MLKYFFIQETLISSVLFEAFRNGLVSITDYKDKEIVLGQVEVFVRPEAVVIVDQSSQSILQLCFILVVHSYAHCQSWISLSYAAPSPDLGQ